MNLLRRFGVCSIAGLMVCALTGSEVRAQDWVTYTYPEPLYRSYIQSDSLIGGDSDYTQGMLFLPLYQSDNELLVLDVRGHAADNDVWEGNVGLAWRTTNGDPNGWIYGRYLYFDRRNTAADNDFNQLTFGVEMLSVDWDVRLNGYIPQDDGEAVGPHRAVHRSGTIQVEQDQEFAYYGGDLEIGYLLADSDDGQFELRVFGAGFYFDRDERGLSEIAGARARAELRWFDLPLLGEGSRLMVGAEYQYDDVRGDISGALVSLRVPLGCDRRCRRPSRLQRRMLNPVVRDVNIITDIGIASETGLDAETDAPFGPVTVVNRETVDIPGAVAAAGPGSVVIADGSLGQLDLAAPIVMQDGQTIRGAGFTVVGKESGARVTFGSRPTMNGTNAGLNVVSLANNSLLRDVDVTGGLNGIFGDTLTGFTVSGNHVSLAAASGLQLNGTVSGTVTGNTFANNGLNGASLAALGGGSIDNNVATGNAGSGFQIVTLGGGSVSDNNASGNVTHGFDVGLVSNGDLTDNRATANGQHGFSIGTFQGAGSIDSNTADQNTGDGFRIGLIDFDVATSPEFSNNVATRNNNGIYIVDFDGGRVTDATSSNNRNHGFRIENFGQGTLSNATASGNGGNGFTFDLVTIGVVTDSTADGNTGNGFHIGEMSNGSINDNFTRNNGGSGLFLGRFTNGSIRANQAEQNALNGFTVDVHNFGSLDGNTSSLNTGDGFRITDFLTIGADIENNTASANGSDGFEIGTAGSWTDGELLNNASNNNAENGYRISNRTGGTATGNTASGNADNTLP